MSGLIKVLTTFPLLEKFDEPPVLLEPPVAVKSSPPPILLIVISVATPVPTPGTIAPVYCAPPSPWRMMSCPVLGSTA